MNTLTCDDCGVGFYQNQSNQISCYRCPSGLTTETATSTDIAQCKNINILGKYFSDLKTKTHFVKYHHTTSTFSFNYEIGLLLFGLHTTNEDNGYGFIWKRLEVIRSTYVLLLVVCSIGQYLSPDLLCEPCPIGSYNSIGVITIFTCTLCPSGYTTASVGSTSINQCFCKSSNVFLNKFSF